MEAEALLGRERRARRSVHRLVYIWEAEVKRTVSKDLHPCAPPAPNPRRAHSSHQSCLPLGDALTADPHAWRGTHLLVTALLHARTQAICMFMRMNTNGSSDPACRALRYVK